MSLRSHVELEIGAGAFNSGLRALDAADRARIRAANPRTLKGSANIDSMLRASQPAAPRWDYLVGQSVGRVERIYWVEVHPASSGHSPQEVMRKLEWLLLWLRDKELDKYEKDIVWIATGRSTVNVRTPAVKGLANRGCRFVGRTLAI